MPKTKKDQRPITARLWVFQRERAPLHGVLIMALATCGVIYNFADSPLKNYLTAAAIVALYLLQIRTADEKKDFEHDNKYHPNRPVQRGVVTLRELAVINKIAIALQLICFASFLDMRIFSLGLISQGYALLTKKEFFVREWIRQHFFIYYITHYMQLVILFYAMTQIIQPHHVSPWILVMFFMTGIITTELGRKMYPADEDTTDDTYSAQLGHTGSATAISAFATWMSLVVVYLVSKGTQYWIVGILPVLVLGWLYVCAYHYAVHPDKNNSDNIEKASNLMYLICMLSVIAGA